MNGLSQRHQAGVDKADYHHRGGRGALNHGSDAAAGEKARRLAGGHPAQQRPHAGAGPALQRLPHQVHTEQKQTQPADQIQKLKQIHRCFSFRGACRAFSILL